MEPQIRNCVGAEPEKRNPTVDGKNPAPLAAIMMTRKTRITRGVAYQHIYSIKTYYDHSKLLIVNMTASMFDAKTMVELPYSEPSETIIAPVKVAKSTINFGLNFSSV